MSVYHDEIEIEDFEYDDEEDIYYYPCPCGDRFQITKVLQQSGSAVSYGLTLKEELKAGEEVATCPSCSLIVKVIYDPEHFQKEEEEVKEISSSIDKVKITS